MQACRLPSAQPTGSAPVYRAAVPARSLRTTSRQRSDRRTPGPALRSTASSAWSANAVATQESATDLIQEDQGQQQQQQQQQQPQPFSWVRNWYPVIPESYLDAARPTAVTLLGKPLVLWRDSTGAWNCFEDACPHRLAPLSEGRVEADGIMCSYHGWRFNSEGTCIRIPQAEDAKSAAAACSSRRACATSYPCRRAHGLLWVWADASPSARQDAAAHEPTITPAVREYEAAGGPLSWYMRDLPYSYEILVENLTDPSHLPYSHHKLTPSLTRAQGIAMPMRPNATGSSSEQPGLRPLFSETFVSHTSPNSTLQFFPPSLVVYTANANLTIDMTQVGGSTNTLLYATPTQLGRSRVFTLAIGTPYKPRTLWDVVKAVGTPSFKMAMFTYIMSKTPAWRMHTKFSGKLFDQDGIFLAMQQQRLRAASAAGAPWDKAYYLPTSCDRGVIQARRWIDSVRGAGGPYAYAAAGAQAEVGGPATRREMLDRFEQHTKHCQACKAKLREVERTIAVAPLAGALLFALMCGLLAAARMPGLLACGWASAAGAAAALGVGACAVMYTQAQQLLREFHFVDFSHADNH